MVANSERYKIQYRSDDLQNMKVITLDDEQLKKYEVSTIDGEKIKSTSSKRKRQRLYDVLLDDEIFKYFEDMDWMFFSNKNRIYSSTKLSIKSKHSVDARESRKDGTGNVKCKISNISKGIKCDCDLHIVIACLFVKNPHKFKYVLYKDDNTDRTQVFPENLYWSNSKMKIVENLVVEYEENYTQLPNEEWKSFDTAIGIDLSRFKHHYYSNKGRFRYKNKLILPLPNREYIKFEYKNETRTYKICNLMMDIYNVLPHAEKLTVDHINSNPFDNSITNLRWIRMDEQNLNQDTTIKRKRKFVYKNIKTNVVKICDGICNLAKIIGKSEKTINTYIKAEKECYGYKIIAISDDIYAKAIEDGKYVDNVNFKEDDKFDFEDSQHTSISFESSISLEDSKKYLKDKSRTSKYIFKDTSNNTVRIETSFKSMCELFNVANSSILPYLKNNKPFGNFYIKKISNEEYINALKENKYVDNVYFFEEDNFELTSNNDDIRKSIHNK